MTMVIKGNLREIPGSIPIGTWWDKVLEYRADPAILELPWYLPDLEYLAPEELKTVKAKAKVWHEILEEWPRDITVWWECRRARERGDMPWPIDWELAHPMQGGGLQCGKCKARWSANFDGSPMPDRCNLCGIRWIKGVAE